MQTRAKGSFATAGLRTRRQCATGFCSLAVIQEKHKWRRIAARSGLPSIASTRMARRMIGKPIPDPARVRPCRVARRAGRFLDCHRRRGHGLAHPLVSSGERREGDKNAGRDQCKHLSHDFISREIPGLVGSLGPRGKVPTKGPSPFDSTSRVRFESVTWPRAGPRRSVLLA